MLNRLSLIVLSLSLLAFPMFLAARQSGSMDQSSGSSMQGSTVTATGCLKQGHEQGGGYYLTEDNGKTWELTGRSLPQNVNHKVTVTGMAPKESNAQQRARESKIGSSEKAEAGGNQYGDLHVDQLMVVSDRCQ